MSAVQPIRRTLVGSAILPIAAVALAVIGGVVSADPGESAEATAHVAPAAQEASGGDLYASNCAACHQADGGGLPGTFPPLADNPAAADAAYVAEVIIDGKSGPLDVLGVSYDAVMPPISTLTADEVSAISSYVVALATGDVPEADAGETDTSEPDAAPVEPVDTVPPEPPAEGDAERGHDLFVGSSRLSEGGTACSSCHVAGDVGNLGGNSLGPDLTDVYGRFGGEAGMSAWLANPGSSTMLPIFTDRPMTEAEIADLVSFLADAPDRDRPSDTVDWLLIAGLVGLALLLGGMAIAWRGMRTPYAQTLAQKVRSPR